MPTDSPSLNPIARFFKSVPYHEFFRVLADTLEDAVLVVSNEGNRILVSNHAFLLLSGYARTELEDLSLKDLLPDETGQRALTQILDCWDVTELRLESVPLRTHEGALKLIDILVQPVSPSRTALVLIAHPTSTRIQREDHRRSQKERLETVVQMSKLLLDDTVASIPSVLNLAKRLLSASLVGLYRISATSPDYILDGSLPSEFPQSLPLTDLNPLQSNELWSLGQRPEHTLHKASRSAGLGAFRSSLIGDPAAWVGLLIACWHEVEHIPADAEQLMIVVANLCHIAILLGLQRAAVAKGEKALEQLEADAEGQFSAVTDALLSLDRELNVIQANPAIIRLLGYQPEEIVGLPIQDVLVGPEDVLTILLDATGHQRVAEQKRIVLHRRDGTEVPVHLRAVPLPGKALSQLLVILKDQSEQKAIEDQRETLAQRALLGEVMAIFAHEVRNPINNISTGVQLVASRLGEDDPNYDSLQQVHKECNRLDQLMSDVLFFSRPLELKITPINLAELMDRILARWTPRLNLANVNCHTSYDDDNILAYADARTLEQVIVNLITNALEAMSEGGTLSVAITPAEDEHRAMTKLKIADTGPGIPPDVIDRIFDPFFTTKKDGTGLGLAISRRILTAHKGTIQVESYPDAGTVFSIYLPSAQIYSEEATNERDRTDR